MRIKCGLFSVRYWTLAKVIRIDSRVDFEISPTLRPANFSIAFWFALMLLFRCRDDNHRLRMSTTSSRLVMVFALASSGLLPG